MRLDPYFAAAAKANPDVEHIMLGLMARTEAARIALVHGDFSPKNILIGPSGPVILDAECACYGDPAFDPAFALTHLFLKCARKPQHAPRYLACAAAFWDAYSATVRRTLDPAPPEEHVVTLLPALILARIDGKSPVEYLTDLDIRGKVRAFAKTALRQPEKQLPAFIEAWNREFGS